MSDKIIKCSADEPSIFGYGLHEVTSSLPYTAQMASCLVARRFSRLNISRYLVLFFINFHILLFIWIKACPFSDL